MGLPRAYDLNARGGSTHGQLSQRVDGHRADTALILCCIPDAALMIPADSGPIGLY